jgi:3-phosphoshikimate 1-carboxyvinyltransferase
VIIRPAKRIRGRLEMPGDKSISHRAAMLAALAQGTSRITNFADSEDCAATLHCLSALGVPIDRDGKDVLVTGGGLRGLRAPAAPLDCANSGTTMRLLAGLLTFQNFTSTLTGDSSLRSRPMQRIIDPLRMMGAEIESKDGRAPLVIHGRNSLQPIEYELPVASAQTKSCILLAGLGASGRTKVIEHVPTRDHTERMLRWFGLTVESGDARREGESFVAISTPPGLSARDVQIPGDVSSAAYFAAAAALLEDSELEIANVGLNPSRTLFLSYLKLLGFDVHSESSLEVSNEPAGTVRVNGLSAMKRKSSIQRTIDGTIVAGLIDELPLLAVVGSQIDGGLEIRDARELRVKESDRIAATVGGLSAMGARVEEFEDGLRVSGPTALCGASIDSRGDHRIAMAFTVAGLIARGETEIKDAGCVAVSFPKFFNLIDAVIER